MIKMAQRGCCYHVVVPDLWRVGPKLRHLVIRQAPRFVFLPSVFDGVGSTWVPSVIVIAQLSNKGVGRYTVGVGGYSTPPRR